MNLELHQAIETYRAGRIQEAAALFNHILRRDPNQGDALLHMGMIAYQTGRADVAVDLIRRAMKTKGGDPMVHHNLGCALWALGRLDEAAAALRQAIAIKPDYFNAYNALGAILADQNKFDEAAQAFSKAIELEPNSAEAHSNLGVLLRSHGKVNEAIREFSRAIELAPTMGDYHTNLATAFSDQGELDAVLKSFARAVELKPNDAAIMSNYLYSLHFHPGFDSATILTEHKKWDDRFDKPARAKIAPHENDRSPGAGCGWDMFRRIFGIIRWGAFCCRCFRITITASSRFSAIRMWYSRMNSRRRLPLARMRTGACGGLPTDRRRRRFGAIGSIFSSISRCTWGTTGCRRLR